MKKIQKKLYLVSREVWAKDAKAAISAPGKVYKVEIAADQYQPEPRKPEIGFKTDKKLSPGFVGFDKE